MAKKLMLIIFFILAVVVSLSTAKSFQFRRSVSFPCDHPLRISAPQYFSHCSNICRYSEWSDWSVVSGSIQSVSKSRCSSGQIYTERRTRRQTSYGTNCNSNTESRQVCMPDAADKLIAALGLGGSGQDYSSIQPQQPGSNWLQLSRHTFLTQASRCPQSGGNGQVCQHLTRKRSAYFDDKELSHIEDTEMELIAPLEYSNNNDSIMQFDMEEHGHRFRRQISPENCDSDDVQHVLFVLDSSGSIGRLSYDRMKQAVAKLTPLFCKKVKFSLMTFSSRLNLEFCFDCFENNYNGRQAAANAIKRASYQGGLTYTGEAARCICDNLLSTRCGISPNPSCLDVVFITDGHSNGGRQVCNEIRCLHSKTGVNTYAIGINNYDQNELDCISDGSDYFSAFSFNSFNAFERAIDDVIVRLINGGNPQACAALYPPPRQIPIHPSGGLG